MLRVDGLSYRYADGGRGIEEVSFEAAAGQVTALVGPSGSGKSTVLACVADVLRPAAGTVRMSSSVDDSVGPAALAQFALVTQGCALFEKLKVWENVALADGTPNADSRSRVQSILDRLRIGGLGDAMPSSISLGQRQRVAIAAAVAQRAAVLLADEPTGSLDHANTSRVIDALRAVAEDGRVVVVATHDGSVIDAADAVVHLAPLDGVVA